MNAQRTLTTTALVMALISSNAHCMSHRTLATMCIPRIQTPTVTEKEKEEELKQAKILEAEKTQFIKGLTGAWFTAEIAQSVDNRKWARKSIDDFEKKHGKSITEECKQKAEEEVSRLFAKAFVSVEEVSPGVLKEKK
jgi:hypothetical protein